MIFSKSYCILMQYALATNSRCFSDRAHVGLYSAGSWLEDCLLCFHWFLDGVRHGILFATAFLHMPCTSFLQLFMLHKLLYTLTGQHFSSFLASLITHASTASLTKALSVARLPDSDIKDHLCSMNKPGKCFSLWFNHQNLSNYILEFTPSCCSVLTVSSPNHLSLVLK